MKMWVGGKIVKKVKKWKIEKSGNGEIWKMAYGGFDNIENHGNEK